MVASLRGREPGSRGTSAVESRCQATLEKTEESSLVRQFVILELIVLLFRRYALSYFMHF
jgi:hypothetical protein